MTIFGYARVSTTYQNLDGQITELNAAGCEHIEHETTSGGKGLKDRPIFKALLAKLQSGDTLVVTRLDRLGRSASEMLSIHDELKERGIALRILNMGIDTGTPAGKLLYLVVAGVAEAELETIRERIINGMANSPRKGGKPAVLTPQVLKEIQNSVSRGLTTRDIAKKTGISPASVKRGYQLLKLKSVGKKPKKTIGKAMKMEEIKKVPVGTCADGMTAQ